MVSGVDKMDNECKYTEVYLMKQPGGVYTTYQGELSWGYIVPPPKQVYH